MMIKREKGFTPLEVFKTSGINPLESNSGYNKKMNNKKNKLLTGFTIIELLVVVAIIAVLAAIVLVNVTQYINKGKDAAIKGNMATILTNMAVHYDDNGDYSTFAASNGYAIPSTAVTNAGKAVVNGSKTDTDDQFCACATLFDTTNGTYCVDDTGYKNQTNTDCGTRCTSGTTAADGRCTN